jgi:class 3 adenylate cyclase/tetratricopeptide (TPR) repeat protein
MICLRCSCPVLIGQKFCSNCGLALTPAGAAAASAGGARLHGADQGEFRHISIIFSDLENSVGLTSELGAELFREFLREYRELAAQVFAKYGGHIARYLGDGTLVYFGYPRMHEDSARRAVHAAFELIGALRRQGAVFEAKWRVAPRVRIAVHTGIVVVGDLRSETTTEVSAIVGDAPNLAARLQSLAEPGSVLISGATHDLIRQDFKCTGLGPRTLKGFAAPIDVYRVDEVVAQRTRFDARPRRSKLIGRAAEAQILADAWAGALAGQGRSLLVLGEPGIGKSRLIAEVVRLAEADAARTVVLQCSSIYQNTALHPVVDFLTSLFGLTPDQDEAERLRRLDLLFLSRDLDRARYVPLFASLLGISLPENEFPPTRQSPQQEREDVKTRLGDWLLHMAERQPILLVVEDLHWADASTIELLVALLPRLLPSRVLVVMSARNDMAAGALPAGLTETLELRRLGTEDTASLIRAAARGSALPRAAIELIAAKTDGVPLFIEEVTRTVLDASLDDRRGPAASVSVPATLAESLAARIDRVAASRELLEVTAALGREFDFDLLCVLWGQDVATLRVELERLVEARLLRLADPERSRYVFAHALIQETIYASVLGSRRRSIHGLIADALTRHFPRLARESPELPAYHYLRAEQGLSALPFLRDAASAAIRRSAHVEASHYLRSAQDVAATLPAGTARTRLELELLVSLGVVLTAAGGYASPDVGQVFDAAHELSRRLDSAAELFPVLHGLYRFFYVRAELGRASELAAQMLLIAQAEDATGLLVEAHRAAGNCCFNKGLFDQAEEHFAIAVGLYDAVAHAAHRYIYTLDPQVGAGSVRALNAACRAQWGQARDLIEEALDFAGRADHPFSLAWCLSFASVIRCMDDDLERLKICADRLIALADQHYYPFWRMAGLMALGWWQHRSGLDSEQGLRLLQQGLEGWERMGQVSFRPFYMSLLARIHLDEGRVSQAQDVLDAALALAIPHGEVWYAAQLRQLMAETV